MKTKENRQYKITAMILSIIMLVSILPLQVFAAQQNSYHDPAEHWMSSSNRTNELDANAVVTSESFYCFTCQKVTAFKIFRTPEYAVGGVSAMTRNVKYSDGTLVGGEGKGSVLFGTPGVDAYYTGFHWTKAICENCGDINTNGNSLTYDMNKNVYKLYSCESSFMEKLDDEVSYEYVDHTHHSKVTKGGTYCGFCYGTYHTETANLESHVMEHEVIPQPANNRFALKDTCTLCKYDETEYVAAKSVITNYYGEVDGKPHTITVNDLSEAGVKTQIRYGNSADSCTLTSAPNYTKKGEYPVYYEIVYTYEGVTITENGVGYVRLGSGYSGGTGNCTCGCGDEDCACEDVNCNGSCHTGPCGGGSGNKNHNYTFNYTVEPTCKSLGYDVYICVGCGSKEKRNYVEAPGHTYQSVLIREASCETPGRILEICSGCGEVKVKDSEKGEHKYSSHKVEATCTHSGYTVKECSVCGDRHITDVTDAVSHTYEAVVTPATCDTGGHTLHICKGCGSSFITDYTDPINHKWDEGKMVIDPTCAGEGLKEYHCTLCGISRLEKVAGGIDDSCGTGIGSIIGTITSTTTNTLTHAGHIAGPEATCTTPQICIVCKGILAEAKGHNFWDEDTEATCTSMGYTTHTCINCGLSYRDEYTDALGHEYTAEVTDPTCLEAGYTTYTCSRCGDSFVTNYREALGHDWDEGKKIVNSTCNGAGMTEYRCDHCNATRLESESATGHTPGAAATCTEPQLCVDCRAVLENAKGHDFNAEITDPTCTQIGYTTYTCKDCGLSYKTDYTNPLGHRHEAEVTEPTCTEMGYTTYTCDRCNDTYVSDVTEALGHKWDKGTHVVDSTCEALTRFVKRIAGRSHARISEISDFVKFTANGEGMTEYRCERCDYRRLETESAIGHTPGAAATCTTPQLCETCGAVIINALGHDYEAVETKPTCTSMGYTTYTCIRCGDSYKSDYTEATGHKYSDWIIDNKPTVNTEGSKHRECVNCGEILETEVIEKIYKQATTDTKGEAVVGDYVIIINDTNTKNPVSNAIVTLHENGKVSILLPDGRLIDYKEKTTVTVLLNEIRTPVSGVLISVTDKNNNYSAGLSDPAGQITVPATSGKTDGNGNVTAGYEDADGNKITLTIKVEDPETKRPVEGADVSVGKTGNITIILPEGIDFDKNHQINVTVTDNKKNPQDDIDVIIKNDIGNKADDTTDNKGEVKVPVVENAEKHGAYIYGYPDGTVRPDGNMSRAEAAAVFARLLSEKKGEDIPLAASTGFNDVESNAWYAGYIKYLSGYSIIEGYSDGRFAPNDKVTRAEFIAMAVRFFKAYSDAANEADSKEHAGFIDISNSKWAEDYINEAAKLGFVEGYGNGSFKGTSDITRAEVVTITNRILKREADKSYVDDNLKKLNIFSDLKNKNYWAYYQVIEAANSHSAVMSDGEVWK